MIPKAKLHKDGICPKWYYWYEEVETRDEAIIKDLKEILNMAIICKHELIADKLRKLIKELKE